MVNDGDDTPRGAQQWHMDILASRNNSVDLASCMQLSRVGAICHQSFGRRLALYIRSSILFIRCELSDMSSSWGDKVVGWRLDGLEHDHKLEYWPYCMPCSIYDSEHNCGVWYRHIGYMLPYVRIPKPSIHQVAVPRSQLTSPIQEFRLHAKLSPKQRHWWRMHIPYDLGPEPDLCIASDE